jgi:alpha-tubulin suppressor-like RCC1 family protein
MTFGVNNTINCVNQSSARTDLTPLPILQLSGSGCQFQVTPVFSVVSLAALPAAADNTGRFVFVQDISAYRFSDGISWTNDFLSSLVSQAYAWGAGSVGNLGDNSVTQKSSPVSVVGGFTDWCQVSAGDAFSLTVRQNGTAWGWGQNNCGQLGDNNIVSRSSPVSVVGGFTDWCQVAAGFSQHSLGVRTNGTAWAWGCNGQGQLGDNTTVNKSSPVLVVGFATGWCQVSAGQSFSLGVRTNGTAWAWGCNNCGILGDGTTVSKSSPVSVVGGFTDWFQISAGTNHSLAIRQNGTAWGWGFNNAGRIGDGTTTNRSSPVSVVGGFTDWCQISAGNSHSLAVRQNGTAWAWGRNGSGESGDNTTVSKSSPVSVVGGFTDWCQISAGSIFSIALRQNGTAWAWGIASNGRLGDNSIVDKSSPVSVVGGFTDWWEVSAGDAHSLAIRKICGF